MGHVSNSKRVLEEAYQTGTAILGNMSSQRERLKVRHFCDVTYVTPMLCRVFQLVLSASRFKVICRDLRLHMSIKPATVEVCLTGCTAQGA